jgi:hypothetical protein
MQNILTEKQVADLQSAGIENHIPLVKLTAGPITWLATCIDKGFLSGYADAGMGYVGWGALMKVDQLDSFKVSGWIPLAVDSFFRPDESLKFEDYCDMKSLSECSGGPASKPKFDWANNQDKNHSIASENQKAAISTMQENAEACKKELDAARNK